MKDLKKINSIIAAKQMVGLIGGVVSTIAGMVLIGKYIPKMNRQLANFENTH